MYWILILSTTRDRSKSTAYSPFSDFALAFFLLFAQSIPATFQEIQYFFFWPLPCLASLGQSIRTCLLVASAFRYWPAFIRCELVSENVLTFRHSRLSSPLPVNIESFLAIIYNSGLSFVLLIRHIFYHVHECPLYFIYTDIFLYIYFSLMFHYGVRSMNCVPIHRPKLLTWLTYAHT